MKILKPITDNKFNSTDDLRHSIFLAGPCPRENYSEDWRFTAFDILKELGFTGTVITPTNEHYQEYLQNHDKYEALTKQTEWEYETMKKCSALVFWIPRSKERPARTTNIEFGDWYNREGVYVGWPEDSIHNEYLDVRLNMIGKKRYDDLKTLLAAVVHDLQDRDTQVFFTSDTHFGQERTLALSRRPFKSVWDMDLSMISNWNKIVTMKDRVLHAGDFGDIATMESVISNLNFHTLMLYPGNYDKERQEEILKIFDKCNRNLVWCTKPIKIHDDISGFTYYIAHEPDSGSFKPKYDKKEFVLFGHIHGRQFAKNNGIDIGVDYHNFTPVTLDQVRWYVSVHPHWEYNVFCKDARIPKR